MNHHQCLTQKSLTTVRKWLFEGGDGLSTPPIHVSSSRLNHNLKQKPSSNRIIKRKRFNNLKYFSKTTSIVSWFYEFIRNIFTAYDESLLYSHASDDTNRSIMTCSTCQFEDVHTHANIIQSALKLNESHFVFQSSKSTQTQAITHAKQSKIYPLYCFSMKDDQILSLQFNNEMFESCDSPIDSVVPLLTTDIHSYCSYQPTIVSVSNTISLQTTENFKDNHTIPKIHRLPSSLDDTRTCHFDKRNCSIEYYHSSNTEKTYLLNRHHSASTDAPEIVFAESTCQLIKQAWSSPISD